MDRDAIRTSMNSIPIDRSEMDDEDLPESSYSTSFRSENTAQDLSEDTYELGGSFKLTYLEVQKNAQENLRSSRNVMPPVMVNYTEPADPEYHRLIITPVPSKAPHEEVVEVATQIVQAMQLRKSYIYEPSVATKTTPTLLNKYNNDSELQASPTAPFKPFEAPQIPSSEHVIHEENGVFTVYSSLEDQESNKPLIETPKLNQYYKDLNILLQIISHGPAKTVCFKRLHLLEAKYNLHILLNEMEEISTSKAVPHRDFYNVRKVDTHIHHSSAMNQKHLLKFIKTKLRTKPNETVIIRDGKELTLEEVFKSLELTTYDLSVDTLDVHADKHTFHRFDKFNLKYNPCGQSRLREIFLKTDNYVKGRYLAEITKELFRDLETSKYQYAEYRVSIYGRKRTEFETLAGWVVNNRLFSENVRWLIQIPRLYSDFKKNNMINNMGELIHNIFAPLFEATKNPEKNPVLACFLQQVVGFDCVDDESKPTKHFTRKYPAPKEWNFADNPPYTYYLFYLWANIRSLNRFREERGLNIFSFRPHSGEAGEVDHLASAFLLANGISHGINLRKAPVLQYLFYLAQIGIAVSPLSNNSLFLNYNRNPFPSFFARGLNVSLSTDDPLQFHYTKEPLIEEYSIAAQVWKFSTCDQCEISRNSVLQSGFEHCVKMHWLGKQYWLEDTQGNDITRTNVPNIRIHFRYQNLMEELQFVLNAVEGTDIDTSIISSRLQKKFNNMGC